MIKFNIECVFSKELEVNRLKSSSDQETKKIEPGSIQDKPKLDNVADELRDTRKLEKESHENILKAQEALNLELKENLNGIKEIVSNTQNCLAIVEKISSDNILIRQQLEVIQSGEARRSLGETKSQTGKVKENKSDVGLVQTTTLDDFEEDREFRVCRKENKGSDNFVSPVSYKTSQTICTGDDDKFQSKKITSQEESLTDDMIKCCYCDQFHQKSRPKKISDKKDKTVQTAERNSDDKRERSQPHNLTSASSTWPLRKSSLCASKKSTPTEKKYDASVPERIEDSSDRVCEDRSRNEQVDKSNNDDLVVLEDKKFEHELKSEIPSPRSKVSDLPQKDSTKCKICKTSGCNLSKLGKYSASSHNKPKSREILSGGITGTGTSASGITRPGVTGTSKCHSSPSQARGKGQVSKKPFSCGASTSESPLNVANDICKRHVQNCKVHGCIPPITQAERKGTPCHRQETSSQENNELLTVNIQNNICHEYQESTHIKESQGIQAFSGKNNGNNTCAENMCYERRISASHEKKGDCISSNISKKSTINDNKRQCDPVPNSQSISGETDTRQDITCHTLQDVNNNASLNGIFSTSKRKLLAVAQEAKRNREYKYMWIRGGKVFMKKEEDSPVLTISNLADINNL